jgi:hypothetical protein
MPDSGDDLLSSFLVALRLGQTATRGDRGRARDGADQRASVCGAALPGLRQALGAAGGVGGVVLGQQRLGIGLVSLIATLSADGRLPLRTIQRYLATVHQVQLSLGSVSAVLQRVAAQGAAAVQQIQTQVQASPVVHADETRWREHGRNSSIWTFSTPSERYFVCGRRTKAMVDAALGTEFDGVLVTDSYAA